MGKLNSRKASVSLVIIGMIGLSLAGCSSKNEAGGASSSVPTVSPASTEMAAPAAKKEPVTLKWYSTSGNANLPATKTLLADYKAYSGNTVELETVAGDGDVIYKKIDIDLSTSGTVDVIPLQNPIIHAKYANSGFLLPLNDIYKDTGVDYEKKFGKYLTKFSDKVYMLPTGAGTWAVFYNKKIFDDAKVPYPKGEWTWIQYVETAQKLTDPSKGIYGSSFPDYDNTFYLLAAQRGISGYKADGTSNYDDPAFKESLQWLGDLGNKLKIQPSWLETKAKKIPYDAFMNGKYAMQFTGTWFAFAPIDMKTYPRDWKVGVTQPPVDPNGKNMIGITSGNGINKYSKHPKEAADFVNWLADNQYKYGGSGTPARVDLTKEDTDKIFQEMAAKFPAADGITTEDLKDVFLTPNLGLKPEKITGSIAAEYGKIILQEGESYLVGQKPLDDAIKAIKSRADEAIEKAKTLKN
ncbi:sugar ABC transporter substrate-binding protein [Paenibacillus marchantiophytorum]|uniref:Sugar ABC transporter substrate-binding protein n=1 Tax=Paenibacillus marchantiophytorum TaxID=1619310 RepID=A0ABQ2BTA8_9BACL|nr:extracellular solute-binding protein [Paenibacillus marchantiophytorum]GGI45600.1 sugar ABC transporter substrate-binding protein [Paenibacillus marchantiophytorum]